MSEMDWTYLQACWKALIEVIALLNISSLAVAAEWWLQIIFPFSDTHEILNTIFSPCWWLLQLDFSLAPLHG